MNPTEEISSFFQIFFKLFTEIIFVPFLNFLNRLNPSTRKDEITINININTRPSRRTRVSFGQLEIREYESILGDNPSCSRGPPLSIGWKYDPERIINVSVDAFENRSSRRDRHRISEIDLLMDRAEREQTLLDLGYTKAEIAAATRQTLRAKKKRRQTADNLHTIYIEEKVEGIKKSFRRNLFQKKGTKSLYKDWRKSGDANMATQRAQRHHSILVLSREGTRRESETTGSTEDDSVAHDIVGRGNHTKAADLNLTRAKSSFL